MLDLPFEKAFVILKIELKNNVLIIAESINNTLTNGPPSTISTFKVIKRDQLFT